VPNPPEPDTQAPEGQRIELGPRDPRGLFDAPPWLRTMGAAAWLTVGVTVAIGGAVWILAVTHTIVMPVLAASVVAAVASPAVHWLTRHRVGRGIASALLLLSFVVLSIVVATIIVGGITGEAGALDSNLSAAKDTIAGWLTDVGVDGSAAHNATADASSGLSAGVGALLKGVGAGLKALSGVVVFLSLTALSLFFLLKDGPMIRNWAEGHMRMPRPVAHGITQRVLSVAARLLRRRHGGRRLQRHPRRRRRAHPRRSARRVDRGDHLPRRLRPVPRRVVGRRLQRADRAGRSGHRRGDRDGGDPAAGERDPSADDPADRVRRGARDPPARGADRDDRRRRPVRGGGLILAAPLTSAATRIASDLSKARAP